MRVRPRQDNRSSQGTAALWPSILNRPAKFHREPVSASFFSITSSMRKCSSARRSQSRSRSASSSKSKIAAARRRRSSRESLGSSAKISDALTSNHTNRGDVDFNSYSPVGAAILADRMGSRNLTEGNSESFDAFASRSLTLAPRVL